MLGSVCGVLYHCLTASIKFFLTTCLGFMLFYYTYCTRLHVLIHRVNKGRTMCKQQVCNVFILRIYSYIKKNSFFILRINRLTSCKQIGILLMNVQFSLIALISLLLFVLDRTYCLYVVTCYINVSSGNMAN